MQEVKLTKLGNYNSHTESSAPKQNPLRRALDIIVNGLNLENGSLKVFVHQGKASPRIEIQRDISKDIEV